MSDAPRPEADNTPCGGHGFNVYRRDPNGLWFCDSCGQDMDESFQDKHPANLRQEKIE